METAKHTPKITWKVSANGVRYDLIVEDDRIKGLMQDIGTINRKQDVEFIVRACNSHEDLIDACKGFLEIRDGQGKGYTYEQLNSSIYNMRIALAKAEGK